MLTSQINDRPAISITVGSELGAVQDVFVLVDTGFTAELNISQECADQLGIKGEYVESVGLAAGKSIPMWVGSAYASLEGQTEKVSVLIGGKPAIGVGLLKKFGYILTLDFTKNIFTLERRDGLPVVGSDFEE